MRRLRDRFNPRDAALWRIKKYTKEFTALVINDCASPKDKSQLQKCQTNRLAMSKINQIPYGPFPSFFSLNFTSKAWIGKLAGPGFFV